MEETYQSAPPVMTIAPLDEEEATTAPSGKGLRPGMAVIRLAGDAAMIGEYRETWWAANKQAFGPTIEGQIQPELREISLRIDSPNARLVRSQARPTRNDRGELVEGEIIITCDWSATRDYYRRKGWLRVDPILKIYDIADTGLLDRSQWRHPKPHQDVCDAMCDPDILVDIAQLNGVHWQPYHRDLMAHYLTRKLQSSLGGVDNRADRQKAKLHLKKAIAKWQEAFDKANKILMNEIDKALEATDLKRTTDELRAALKVADKDQVLAWLDDEEGSESPRPSALRLMNAHLDALEVKVTDDEDLPRGTVKDLREFLKSASIEEVENALREEVGDDNRPTAVKLMEARIKALGKGVQA